MLPSFQARCWTLQVLLVFISTFFVSLLLSACRPVGAVSQRTSECTDRESQVSIKPASRKELDIEGRKYTYGVFVLSNKTGRPVQVFADIRQQKYWMIHPNSILLQQKEGDSWKGVVRTLSEYSGPDAKVRVPANEEWQFLYPLHDLIESGAGRNRMFRLVVTDAGRCAISSESFTLGSLSEIEQAY